jgi:SAM-dependent methyltransferase
MLSDSLTMPLDYKQRMTRHVDDYFQTVIDFPEVRANEFLQLRDYACLPSASASSSGLLQVLEVPAEGPILERLLPEARISRADFLKVRLPEYADKISVTDWDLNGIAANSYDAVLSIVPIHHASVAQKKAYITAAFRVLKPGGRLAFAEVEKGSRVQIFLDDFVDQNTVTGHLGEYPGAAFEGVFVQAGFMQVQSQVLACPWRFENRQLAQAYVSRLFALNPMPAVDLLAALDAYLGLTERDDQLWMDWSLRYFSGTKPA